MRVRKNVLTGIVVGGMIFSAGVLHAQVATPRPTDSSAAEPGSEPGTSDMSEVVVTGDETLAEYWLSRTAFL